MRSSKLSLATQPECLGFMRPCLKETYQQNHDKHMQANVYMKTQRTELAQTILQREEQRAGLWLGDRARVTPPQTDISIKAQGASRKRRWKGCNSQKMVRSAVKCSLLDISWLSHSRHHRIVTTYTRPAQIQDSQGALMGHRQGGVLQTSPPNVDLEEIKS